jgi:hypothetical protein
MELSEAHFVECGKLVTVKKTVITYTITSSLTDYMGNGATLDPDGESVVSAGEDLEFTVTNPGTDLIAVQIDEGEFAYLGSDNPTTYTLENIQADHTILFITTGAG